MNKVVYLIEQPLSIWNYNRFGIQNWLDRGWNIEVWDLTQFLNPVIFETFKNNNVEIKKFDGYIPISSESILKQQCSVVNKPAYYVDCIANHSPHARIKKYLAQIGVTRIMSYLGFQPPLYSGGSTSDKLVNRIIIRLGLLIKTGPVNAIKWIINSVRMKLVSSSFKPGVIVVSGEKSIPKNVSSADIVAAHNLDYDLFLKLKDINDSSELIKQPYAVFLDQDVCFHSDLLFEFDVPPVKPENYFPRLCTTLREISDSLGYSLCVAGHPRSPCKQKHSDYFEGIPVKYGVTAELIKNCSVVVCHNSTAIQLAVLFKKPLIFLTTEQLEQLDAGKHIPVMAAALGKSIIYIDQDTSDVNWVNELKIDYGKYSDYKRNYVKMENSSEKPSWDILIDFLEKKNE